MVMLLSVWIFLTKERYAVEINSIKLTIDNLANTTQQIVPINKCINTISCVLPLINQVSKVELTA